MTGLRRCHARLGSMSQLTFCRGMSDALERTLAEWNLGQQVWKLLHGWPLYEHDRPTRLE